MSHTVAELNKIKRAPAVEGVLPLIHQRWSPRAFADKPVTSAQLITIFEAARWAPSSGNGQPWRFLVGQLGDSTHSKILSALVDFNQLWAANAPVLILGTSLSINPKNRNPNAYALFDLGAATFSIALQAEHMGLTAHQMAGFDRDAARKTFAIPEEYALGSVMALGYQGEPSALANEELKKREVAPRERKPLKEVVFASWDTPASFA
jgi:nitroreductase